MNNYIGQKVTRIEGDYSVWGNRGTINELDDGNKSKRARIQWDNRTYRNRDGELCSVKMPRTWIKLTSLTDSEYYTDEQIRATKVQMRAASEARFKKKYGHLV